MGAGGGDGQAGSSAGAHHYPVLLAGDATAGGCTGCLHLHLICTVMSCLLCILCTSGCGGDNRILHMACVVSLWCTSDVGCKVTFLLCQVILEH